LLPMQQRVFSRLVDSSALQPIPREKEPEPIKHIKGLGWGWI
jgi:hypothetical protein